MFYKIARLINALGAITLLVIIMRYAYNTWSLYGPYTVTSFVISFLMHGAFCYAIYWGIDYLLRKIAKHV